MIDFGDEDSGFEARGEGGPDLTPMIDVIFQLLVFFLLTSFALAPSLEILLPRSAAAETRDRTRIEIAVPEEGSILLDGKPIKDEEIRARLLRARSAGEEALTVRADRETGFGRVVLVLDAAESAGFEQVDFLTEPER